MEIIEITSTKSIPVRMDLRLNGNNIETEAQVKAWAIQHNVKTVYWLKSQHSVFGYAVVI